MLNIKDLTESKEMAREEMSAIRGGNDPAMGGKAKLYPGFTGPSFTSIFNDNDMVSASIGQTMLNDIDAAFANVDNNSSQSANINTFT